MGTRFTPLRLLGLALLPLAIAACGGTAAPASSGAAQTAAGPGAAKLIVDADVVRGSTNVAPADAAAQACVLNNRFARNSQIVWRARVTDPKTGDFMDDKAVSKLQVVMGDGKTYDMKYGMHPKEPPQEAFWTGSWVIPKDQPTGTLKWTIKATAADGRTGEYKPFISPTSQLIVLDQVVPDVPTGSAAAKPSAGASAPASAAAKKS